MKTLFENAREAGEFERQGWAKVGRGYELKHVLMSLIAQVEPGVDDESLVDATEDQLSEYLHKALENRRYMIVLDGVDDAELLAYLLTASFPDESNGSVVLVATTSQEVVQSGDVMYNYVAADTFEEDILRHGLFGFKSIPVELEAAGKEILHNTADEIAEMDEIEREMNLHVRAPDLIDFSNQVRIVTKWLYPTRYSYDRSDCCCLRFLSPWLPTVCYASFVLMLPISKLELRKHEGALQVNNIVVGTAEGVAFLHGGITSIR